MVSRFVALSGLLALALNAVPVARADVLELADGRVIEGVAVRDGDVWRVASRFGVVELPAADVKNHVAGPSLDAQIEGALAYVDMLAPRPDAVRFKQLRATLEAAHNRLHHRMHRAGVYHEHTVLHGHAEGREH